MFEPQIPFLLSRRLFLVTRVVLEVAAGVHHRGKPGVEYWLIFDHWRWDVSGYQGASEAPVSD